MAKKEGIPFFFDQVSQYFVSEGIDTTVYPDHIAQRALRQAAEFAIGLQVKAKRPLFVEVPPYGYLGMLPEKSSHFPASAAPVAEVQRAFFLKTVQDFYRFADWYCVEEWIEEFFQADLRFKQVLYSFCQRYLAFSGTVVTLEHMKWAMIELLTQDLKDLHCVVPYSSVESRKENFLRLMADYKRSPNVFARKLCENHEWWRKSSLR